MGHSYAAPIARRDKGSGCRKCADKKNPELRRKAFEYNHKSLADVCPHLIKEYAPDNPLSIFAISAGSNQKVKWICLVCGNKWEASPSTRKQGHGCPQCGVKKMLEARKKNAEEKLVGIVDSDSTDEL